MTKKKDDDKKTNRILGKTSVPKDKQDEKTPEQLWTESIKKKGGVYFHAGAIIGRKNVFVTSEYMDLLVNAFKMAELQKDVKNLAFVIMPNFFYWMFRLNDRQDNPMPVYGEVKRDVARDLLNLLHEERKADTFELLDIFKANEKVGRSTPEKILWTFEEHGKRFKKTKRYRVWAPRTELRLIESDELLQQKLKFIKNAPTSARWNMVKKSEDYPYLYLSDELSEKEKVKFSEVCLQVPKLATV